MRSEKRFCSHFPTSGFDSGKQKFNDALKTYGQRFLQGYPDIVFVAVDSNDDILGYVAIQEVVIRLMNERRRFLYLPHLAVSNREKGTDCAVDLVTRAYRTYDLLQEEYTVEGRELYFGVVVNSHSDPRIEMILWRHGYRSMPENRGLWWTRNPHDPVSG